MPFDLPIDLSGGILEGVPRTLVAAVLLGAPTVMWILYRSWIGPRRRRLQDARADDDQWPCGSCASINPASSDRCYRCHSRRGEGDIGEPATQSPIPPPDTGVGVPVMATGASAVALPIGESAVALPIGESAVALPIGESAVALHIGDDISGAPAEPEAIPLPAVAGPPRRMVVVATSPRGPAQGQPAVTGGTAGEPEGADETVDPEFARLMAAFPSEGRPRRP